jgi:hypothetical protein
MENLARPFAGRRAELEERRAIREFQFQHAAGRVYAGQFLERNLEPFFAAE